MFGSQRLVYLIGVLFVLVAVGQAGLKITIGGPLLEVAIDLALMSLPGVLLLYVGSWLSSTEIDPELNPRIIGWCLGGVGVMVVFLTLRAVHPGVSTSFAFGTRAIALAIGSIAGMGIGIYEAAAITQRRKIDRHNHELVRTRAQLERRNEELHRTQQELEDVVSRLEASNERLEQFAHAASHDLQEPLRMVSSYLRLLESRYSDDLDDDAAEFVEFAVDGAERMQTMVVDLLAYSRVDSQGNSFEPIDLETVLDDVLTDLQMRIEESDATITIDSIPVVRGDASQLRQLLQNLLSNAIDYSDGPPRIHVSAEKRSGEWVISVTDEGVGISPDAHQRIFDIFQRHHTDAEHAGSGIGLALCQRIVERHGGDIWVESEPGTGSTFFFTVPRGDEPPLSPNANSHSPDTVGTDGDDVFPVSD